MCILCDQGKPQNHSRSQLGRRDFLKASTLAAAGASGMSLFNAPARADNDRDEGPPRDSGRPKRRYVIRGGHVMTMDASAPVDERNFVSADVLVEGKRIVDIKPNLGRVGGAGEIDARGKIVMPGFIDTHHHQFETALRSFLADGILINDGSGSPSANPTYFEYILQKFAPVYRPRDVYINELFGGLAQLDNGVTTVHDVSQIHHSPQHTDAAIQALFDTGRRAAFGYFESAGGVSGNQYPTDATRIRKQWFTSNEQLVTMIMGGEIYLPGYEAAWNIGRGLGLQIAAHILSPFGMRPTFDALAAGTGGDSGTLGIGADNLFIHMTGMSDQAWTEVRDKGAQVSVAFPIEMNMRHGIPPVAKLQELGMEPSLSTDVEVTMTADFFTQMRSAMTMQRMMVNQAILEQGNFVFPNQWPTPTADKPPLYNVRDVLRFATMNGAKHLRLDRKTGSLKVDKEADIIILDATSINVAPLNNVPNAVVSLMERTNVETVIVAGKIRKWKGKLQDVDLRSLRHQLEASRNYIFQAAGVQQDLFFGDPKT